VSPALCPRRGSLPASRSRVPAAIVRLPGRGWRGDPCLRQWSAHRRIQAAGRPAMAPHVGPPQSEQAPELEAHAQDRHPLVATRANLPSLSKPASDRHTQGKSRVRQLRTHGSVEGVLSDRHSYSDCQPRHKSSTGRAKPSASRHLWECCGTFVLQRSFCYLTIRHAQHGACLLPVQHQIRLAQQAADVGARVMADHRLRGVSEQRRSILGRDAGRAEALAPSQDMRSLEAIRIHVELLVEITPCAVGEGRPVRSASQLKVRCAGSPSAGVARPDPG
jgi:hypothetical protein